MARGAESTRGRRNTTSAVKQKSSVGKKKSITKAKQKSSRINAKAVKEHIARLNADSAAVAEVTQLASNANSTSKPSKTLALDVHALTRDLHEDKQNSLQKKQTNQDLVAQLEQMAGMEL